MDQQSSQPLVCPSHQTHYVIAFILGALIGGCALSAYGYHKGFASAYKLVTDSQMGLMFKIPDDVRMLSGVVTAVNADSIVIKTRQNSPFEDPAIASRTIVIATDTKITKRSMGDIDAYRTAMDDFMKKMQSGAKSAGTPPTPPEPVTTTIALSDIKVDDTVTVSTVDNVAFSKSFPASEVQVQ
ncbi:MAG: hypothetical protein WC791_02085 [Candidatus Paceibacterota bacterium]|jgi:hypothetical protein